MSHKRAALSGLSRACRFQLRARHCWWLMPLGLVCFWLLHGCATELIPDRAPSASWVE